MSTRDELKILRRRQAELAARLDQRRDRRGSRSGAVSFLGQIFNGGHMPTSLPAYFLVHPITNVGGVESEGQSVTTDVNTNALCPIIVVGTRVPAVGDILPVDLIAGRWIAERYGAGIPTSPGNFCFGVTVPTTLKLTVSESVSGSPCHTGIGLPPPFGPGTDQPFGPITSPLTDTMTWHATNDPAFPPHVNQGVYLGSSSYSVPPYTGSDGAFHNGPVKLALVCSSADGDWITVWYTPGDPGGYLPLYRSSPTGFRAVFSPPEDYLIRYTQGSCTYTYANP